MLKRGIIVMVGILLVLPLLGPLHAAKRYVLAEMFTNVGCPPCRAADSTMDTISADWGDSLVIIRYHVYWPGYDPMYYHNSSEIMARNNYYGNEYTPHLFIDGFVDAQYFPSQWRYRISSEFDVPSLFTMNFEGLFDTVGMKGKLTCTIAHVENDTLPANVTLKLRYATVQNHIYYIGSNGWSNHDETFLDMFPSTQGVNIGRPSPGDTIVDTETFPLDPFVSPQHPVWAWGDIEIAAFLQDDATKKVYQAGKIDLVDLTLFACGDVNDDGIVDMFDLVYISNYLYSGGPAPDPIISGDLNGDGTVNFADLNWGANYLFFNGPAPNCIGQ